VSAVSVLVAILLSALAGSPAFGFDSRILFARATPVPEAVQQFAWRVIEERCDYQSFERTQRSFWAYDARARGVGEGTAYTIKIVSDVAWRKNEPSAYIDMTIVAADRQLRVTALTSSFIGCSLSPGASAGDGAAAAVETTR